MRERATDPLAGVRRLHRDGIAKNDAGQPARALRLLRRALQRLDELELDGPDERDRQRLRAHVWISIASSESELNGLEAGLAALSSANNHARIARDPRLEFLSHSQMGYMRLRGGHVEGAVHDLDRAEELIGHAEPMDAYRLMLNRGTTHLFRGNLVRARADLVAAATIANDNDWPTERAKARHNLGYLEFLAGNLATALRIMDEVRAVESGLSLAVVLLDRARVLVEAGLHREADASLSEAHALFRAARLWNDVGEVELARAECALLGGEIEAARRLAGAARTRFRRRSNDRWRREAELTLLQADHTAGRPGTRLAGPALRLADEFGAARMPSRERAARLIAAEALLRSGHVDKARAVAGEAGPVRPNDPVSARLQIRLVRAKLHVVAGNAGAARREIRSGLAELTRHQARFGSLDLQTAGAIHGRQLAELYLDLSLTRADPVAALAAVEQSRAVAARLRLVEAPDDETNAALLSELRQTAEQLRAIESDPNAAGVVAATRKRIADLQRMLRAQSWQADGSGDAADPASFASIANGLHEYSSLLVSFFQARGGLHGLVVEDGRARLVSLASIGTVHEAGRRIRASLDVLASGDLTGPLLGAVQGSLNRSLATLDELMLAPLKLSDAALVLTPTGPLTALPWNLIPSLRGRPLVVAPSATAWLAAAGKHSPRDTIGVSAFAGPGLHHAEAEAKAVGRCWPGATVFSAGAQRQHLRDALTSSSIVHIAAHGRHEPENPLFSSIRLADGVVYAYEFRPTEYFAEHVVLSACELGQSTIRAGDETLGLTSALLRLGARSVISSVAKVHDEVAAQTMLRYHDLLAAGNNTATALAAATEAATDVPAPFVCFGSAWQTRAQA